MKHFVESQPATTTPEGRQPFQVPSSADSSPDAAAPWTYEYVTAETEDEVKAAVAPSVRSLMVSPTEDEILPAPEEDEEEEEEIVDGPIDSESYVPDHWA